MEKLPTLQSDPNGVAAAIVVVVTALAAAVGAAVDDGTTTALAGTGAAVIDLVAVLVARRQAWAPDTVAELSPETVEAKGVLPLPPS